MCGREWLVKPWRGDGVVCVYVWGWGVFWNGRQGYFPITLPLLPPISQDKGGKAGLVY